jgi:hypothetical protein
MDIPIIETCNIIENAFEEDKKAWRCDFILENDLNKYTIEIHIEKWENEEEWGCSFIYEYLPTGETEPVLTESEMWDDHIFEQLTECIKAHSPNRLRLFSYRKKDYGNKEFISAAYPEIKQITFKTLNTGR